MVSNVMRNISHFRKTELVRATLSIDLNPVSNNSCVNSTFLLRNARAARLYIFSSARPRLEAKSLEACSEEVELDSIVWTVAFREETELELRGELAIMVDVATGILEPKAIGQPM